MDIICVLDCDDCGKSAIMDAEQVSVLLSDEFVGAATCPQCGCPVIVDVDPEIVLDMAEKGVKVFSWRDGKIISKELLKVYIETHKLV